LPLRPWPRRRGNGRETAQGLRRGPDDFPEQTEPAVFGRDESRNDSLRAALSPKLPSPECKAEICGGVGPQSLLRLIAASLPLPQLGAKLVDHRACLSQRCLSNPHLGLRQSNLPNSRLRVRDAGIKGTGTAIWGTPLFYMCLVSTRMMAPFPVPDSARQRALCGIKWPSRSRWTRNVAKG
jgi:hypothetical protein